ncbi:MAG TPA: hypothetical protein VHB25_07335, partial [Gemmatimonadaceae bacterium]|nr:hypothetical protein [Gemmatimonadaceae bacterium]
ELLVRFLSLAGPISVDDVLARYEFDADWVRERLDEWTRTGKLVRGTFAGDSATPRWSSRRLLEQARRRELAHARRQIEAVDLSRFARFMQRWQHLDPATRMEGDEGSVRAIRQLYGIARPAEMWDREYFPARIDGFEPDALARLIALGELAWIGGSPDARPDDAASLSTIRWIRRGTARAWIRPAPSRPLSEHAQRVLEALGHEGASFFDELLATTVLTSRSLRDALRELVGAGLVTNDSLASLHAVIRWRPTVSPRDRTQPDPTRWLPADYTPSANRYVVQRRPNLRRLPKWKRPDKQGAEPTTWPGRWSLVQVPRVLGPDVPEDEWSDILAQQFLERYGIVSREMWRREHPAVSWRTIYRELKRLEFRGEVRRGYFVRGLSGAQFALPQAVEMLRATDADAEPAAIVMAASDPANVYSLPAPGEAARDPFVRPRSRNALLVTIDGVVIVIAERRGGRVAIRPDTDASLVTRAAKVLVSHLAERSSRDLILETIDGEPATASRHAQSFVDAGYRHGTGGLRYYRSL